MVPFVRRLGVSNDVRLVVAGTLVGIGRDGRGRLDRIRRRRFGRGGSQRGVGRGGDLDGGRSVQAELRRIGRIERRRGRGEFGGRWRRRLVNRQCYAGLSAAGGVAVPGRVLVAGSNLRPMSVMYAATSCRLRLRRTTCATIFTFIPIPP